MKLDICEILCLDKLWNPFGGQQQKNESCSMYTTYMWHQWWREKLLCILTVLKRILCVKKMRGKHRQHYMKAQAQRRRDCLCRQISFSIYLVSTKVCSFSVLFKHDTSSHCNITPLSPSLVALFASKKFYKFLFGNIPLPAFNTQRYRCRVHGALIRCWTQFFIQIMAGVERDGERIFLSYIIVESSEHKQMNFSIACWL